MTGNDINAAFVAVVQERSKLGHLLHIIFLDARVSDAHSTCHSKIVQRYSVQGPTLVLDVVHGCAIKLAAAYDIIKFNKCVYNLPKSTEQLDYDLSLILFNPSAVSEAAPLR